MQNISEEETEETREENTEFSPAQQLEFLKSTNKAVEEMNKAMGEYIKIASEE